MKYSEVKKDLFSVDSSYTLAHCISRDCKMGAGIADTFNKRFPKMKPYLLTLSRSIGDALPYSDGVYTTVNLITKENFWHKPTRESFNSALVSLKTLAIEQGITRLAIPLLGAGLDRLSWSVSRTFIQELFADTEIEILVCIK